MSRSYHRSCTVCGHKYNQRTRKLTASVNRAKVNGRRYIPSASMMQTSSTDGAAFKRIFSNWRAEEDSAWYDTGFFSEITKIFNPGGKRFVSHSLFLRDVRRRRTRKFCEHFRDAEMMRLEEDGFESARGEESR